jgi:hypothetical protein
MTSNSRAISGFSERTPSQARLALLAIAGAMVLASPAAADPVEVALLERVSSNSLGVNLMEYVRAGQVIRLGPQDTIVLSYMSSCLRETITGGTVTVGTDWSEVQSGKVQRLRGQCGGGKITLTGAQSPIAGRTFRGLGTVIPDGDRRAQ